jgi:hypothetical protein
MEIDTNYLQAIRRIGASMFIRHVEFQTVGASNSDTRGFILFIVRRWPELAGWCRMPDLRTNSASEHPVFPFSMGECHHCRKHFSQQLCHIDFSMGKHRVNTNPPAPHGGHLSGYPNRLFMRTATL